jgi:dihydroxyacetone kinase-like protein
VNAPNNANDPTSSGLGADFGQRWVAGMLATFDVQAEQLGDLDRKAGDGDFGNNIAAAFRRVRKEADAAQPRDYSGWLTAVSRGFLGTGGTSGPLFGMLFRELARCAVGNEPTLAEFSHGLAAGLATVQRYGKAEVGHKTMVDALTPAVDVLNGRADLASVDGGLLVTAAEAAATGARGTADITARRGRASYVGEVSRGVADPGAVAIALMLRCAANAQQGATAPSDTSGIIDS